MVRLILMFLNKWLQHNMSFTICQKPILIYNTQTNSKSFNKFAYF
jgi:hypothetical protein